MDEDRKPFEEALADLIGKYRDVPHGLLMSALELQLMVLDEDGED